MLNSKERNSGSLQILRVDGRQDLDEFIKLPWSLYASDPMWVPPLLVERRQHLSPKNPYFAHARCSLWLAYKNRKPVGRISAQVDELHLERYQDESGFFGMLEAEDDPEVFHALLDTAENWLRGQGMHRLLGPFNFSINQESGLLVEGFDSPPMIMTGHARPYYHARIVEAGYRQAKDLLAYKMSANFRPPDLMHAVLERATRFVHVRPLRRSRFRDELKIMQEIFEDAWSENWGFIPFTEAEFTHLGQYVKHFVPDEFVQIAEVNGTPAGMIIVFPNLNEIIRDLNGQLFPFGWLKLIWRLKMRGPTTARIPLMGVRKRYQDSPVGTALAFMLINAVQAPVIRRGIRDAELSWILDDNTGMRKMLEAIGAIQYKRYRIYQKELSS